MKVKITTKFSLDPSDPLGRKNLDLMTISAGLRSQIEILSISKNKKDWDMLLFLEHPDYWGHDLETMIGDLENIIVFHKGKPTPAGPLLTFEQIPINNSTGDTDT